MTDDDDEARGVIARGGVFGGDGFGSHHDASAFVEGLYAAGATRVVVREHMLVATLPSDPTLRAAVLAIYDAEVDRFGEELGGEETQGHSMTRDEAIAVGHPEAEGEWVVDDFHVVDTGQTTITFWWD